MKRNCWFANTCMLLATLLAGSATRADEASAVAAIQKTGGAVLTDNKKPGKPVYLVYITGPSDKATDADLRVLKEFKELRNLTLWMVPVTDVGMKELRDLKG